MRDFFVFNIFIRKNLSRFLEIHLQLAKIRVAKTCLGQEITKIEKYGSNIPSNLPIRDTFYKYDRGFYYLVCTQQKTLGDFQNSSPADQKLLLKLTTKPVI
jgi:hypothetical protein